MVAYIEGKTGRWEYVIGLEVHAQIFSNSKLFSTSPTTFGADSNSQVSFVDAAMPGMLPTLNEKCVEEAIKTGLGINARINHFSAFDRKNYFYPDLPQGYQISQFFHPISQNGWLEIINEDNVTKKITIERLHLEQDAGKSIHDGSIQYSLIDLNRAGIGLMEIVSAPEIVSPYEAGEYVKKLRCILRYLGSCDGDMEKGSLRCDANVSVRRSGDKLGTRCEIKNLNSIKHIIAAIEHEAERQVDILESGGHIAQETRLYDVDLGVTRSMRSKEEAADYRYFPDPDLLPIILEQSYIDSIAANMPELPDAKYLRYKNEYALLDEDIKTLISDKFVATYFENLVALGAQAKIAANWIISELFGYLNKANLDIQDCPIKEEQLFELINLIHTGLISGKIAKQVFEMMINTGKPASFIVKEGNLMQISDDASIAKIIDQIIQDNPDNLAAYKAGKDKLFSFFVGQVMKQTEGKANPVLVNKLLHEKL